MGATMDMINLLENEYDLFGVRWKHEPHIVMTDFGEKRIRYWKEEQLLKWHGKWRDESSSGSGAVPDRMIRTRSGDIAVRDGEQWISLHDHSEALFGSFDEKRWGEFIGNLLIAGVQEGEKKEEWPLESCTLNIEKCLSGIKKFEDGNFHFLNTSLYEAEQRLVFAKSLKDKAQVKGLPLLERDISISNGKRIFQYLFYQGGDSWPVRGYLPIRKFLLEWLTHTSEASLKKLLSEIDLTFPLHSGNGLMLLREVVLPWELEEGLNQLQNSSLEKMVQGMREFEALWKENRKLLKIVTEWFDVNRRKVAL
jgi:hypothetical protein